MTETSEQVRPASEKSQCLDPEWLRMLVDGDVSPARIGQIEEHLAICPKCREQLEKESGGAALWELARKSLSAAVPPGAENDASPGVGSPPDPVLSLLEPSTNPEMLGALGAYEIAGVLGKGGMGVVLKAYDPALGRYVAIKLLAPHLAANANARKRFAREAKAAAAVAHDHVIAIHGVSEFKGIPFLVMPLIRGESLQKRLRAEGPLPVEVILRIAMQTASGLAAAHAQGLIHRDVKPANILLGPGTERVTLTDFGLARAVDEVDLTVTGMLPGTPRYMSPEQARGEILDARTDLFSLGLVLYEMAAGQSPFRADSSYAVLRKISEAEPKSLADFRSDLPEWLMQIISRLLAKNPLDRLASARDLERLLSEGLAHLQAPKSNAAPRLGVLTQAAPAREKAYETNPVAQPSSVRETIPAVPVTTNWFSGRLLAGAALIAMVFFFFYPLIKGETFTLTLGLLVVAGLLLFFGPWGFAYRSSVMANSYSPGRRRLQMGVFGLAVFGIGFLIFQVESQVAKMHGIVWTQSNSLQNRLNEWSGLKGAIAAKEWKKENDLLEYAISTVTLARLSPGQSFSLFTGVLVLALIMLATWALSFWNRCHPAWVVAGLGVAVVWTFYSLIQAETTVYKVIAEVNTPEIWQLLRHNAPGVFTDPVVVIADKRDANLKEIQVHIKPGYVVLGVVRNKETGLEIPSMSFWAGQGKSVETPFKLSLQYKVALYPTTLFERTPPKLHFMLAGEPKSLNGGIPLDEGAEMIMEGPAHEAWAFAEADVRTQQKTVPLAQMTWADPKSPRDAVNHLELTLKVVKLPENTLKELSKEFVFKGVHWREAEWHQELGLDNALIIKSLNESGKLVVENEPRGQSGKLVNRNWTFAVPSGMVIELTPVEVEHGSSRPIDMLRCYCFNNSRHTIKLDYGLKLENEPGGNWPKDRPRLTVVIDSVQGPSTDVQTDGNPLWLLSRNWIADPRSTLGPVKTDWNKALDRGVLPAYIGLESASVKGAIEVRNRYYPITLPPGSSAMGTGIGSPWWKALKMEAPVAKGGLHKDEMVDMELSRDGASVKVLGQDIPVNIACALIAKEGFSKNAGLLLHVSRDTPAMHVTKAFEIFKDDGYSDITIEQKEPQAQGAKDSEAGQPSANRSEVIALKHIDAHQCVKMIEELVATGKLATGAGKEGGTKKSELKVVTDPRTNSIFIIGTPAEIEKVKAVVKPIDVPAPRKQGEKQDEKQGDKKEDKNGSKK